VAEPQPRYDVANALRELRYASKRTDVVTLETVRMARDLADHLIRHYEGRDLGLVADALVTTAASIGGLTKGSPMGQFAVNVQAFAGLFLYDAARASVTR
jgi:hypothetical protein